MAAKALPTDPGQWKEKMLTTRRKAYEALESQPDADRLSLAVNAGLTTLILVNVAAVTLESIVDLHERYASTFFALEVASVAIFTVEYLLRVWVGKEAGSRLRYVLSPLGLIDLAAILPFYLGTLTGADLRFLRILRLFRLLKITRYFGTLSVLADVIKAEARAFGAAMLVMVVLTLIAASLMHLAEGEAQPEAFGSIPQAVWWSVVTLTTVGYGDVTPMTPIGRLLGIFVMVLGIGMVALPAGMLASRFSEELHKRRGDFEAAVRRKQQGGTLTHSEKEELEALRLQLCISTDDARRALDRSRGEVRVCPRCGAEFGAID